MRCNRFRLPTSAFPLALCMLSALIAGVTCAVAQAQSLVATLACGPHPTAIAVNQTTNMVYIDDIDVGTLTVINGATNTASTITTGVPTTTDVAVNPMTNTIYALYGGIQTMGLTGTQIIPGSVVVIDGATNTVTKTIALPHLASYMAVNPVTNQVYVSTLTAIGIGAVAAVVVIDGSTNALTNTISIPAPNLVSSLGVDTVRNLIYAMNVNEPGNANLSVIDGATNAIKATVPVGYNDTIFALNTTTNTVYVPDPHGNQIFVIDGATDTIAATVPTPGLQGYGLGVNPVTNEVYLIDSVNGGLAVQALNGSSNTIGSAAVSDVSVGPLLVNSVTNKIWQVSSPVVLIDGATNTATTVTGTGNSLTPLGAGALNTTTNYAYMATANTVYVINGAATGPAFSASPNPLAFGNQTQGTTSSAMALTVTNTGTADLSITTVTLGGPNMADFIIGSNTCANATVAAGKTCTVMAQFAPSTTSSESATLTFADNASNSPQTVNLTGTGVAPVATATTTTLAASATSVAVGTGVTLTATVKPATGTPMPTGTVTFLDGASTLGTGTLNASGVATYAASSLAVGSHSITASYAGDTRNTASTSNAVTVSVTVGATKTSLTASPTSVAVGSSVSFTATVTGTSGVAAPTGTVTSISGSTTLGTGTLNSSGTATYSTSSLAAGSYSVTAAYGGDANNAASTSSAVAVTVWPGAQDFSVSLSPSTGSVSRGNNASVTVTITSINGFSSATNLSCSGLPKDSTCDFSQSSVTPAVAGTATSTMTIKADTNPTTTAINQPENGPESHVLRVASVFAGALFLLPILRWRRRSSHLLLMLSALFFLAFVVSTGMMACGGGPTTPKGNYTVQVSAASGSISKQATFSLTVQ